MGKTLIGTIKGLAPAGGTQGQVLGKASDNDFDFTWVTAGGGSGGAGNGIVYVYSVDVMGLSGGMTFAELMEQRQLTIKGGEPESGEEVNAVIMETDLASLIGTTPTCVYINMSATQPESGDAPYVDVTMCQLMIDTPEESDSDIVEGMLMFQLADTVTQPLPMY